MGKRKTSSDLRCHETTFRLRFLRCGSITPRLIWLCPDTHGSVPFTISAPGKYVLVEDVSLQRGTVAITVTASNVTIDLGGYTLSDGSVPNQHTGISASGVNNLVIQNGSISQFQGGGGISISGGLGVYSVTSQ